MLSTLTTPGYRALLIGINQYPMLVGHDLRGCVNDVLVARELLRDRAGYAETDITLLCDRQATRQNILNALVTLDQATAPGDQVLVYYAGHGSQSRDADGALFETIVPHDSGRGRNPNQDITDIELGTWLYKLAKKTPYITLIFDCCHSGTLTRDLYGDTARWVPPDVRPGNPSRGSTAMITEPGCAHRSGTRVTLVPPSERYVVISACQDEEKAYELSEQSSEGKVVHGTLSYYLLRALAAGAQKESYRDLFERVAAQVNQAQPRQHPRCEGALDRLVFGTGLRPAPRYVLLTAGDKGVLSLGAGAVHGVVIGSEWDLYPTMASVAEGSQVPAGRVRVDSVGALKSLATLMNPTPIALPARAVEVLRPEGDREPRWPVEVRGSDAVVAKLLPLLAQSRLVRPVKAGEPSRLCLSVEENTWSVLGRDGQSRLLRSHTVASEADESAICDGLERLVRYERVRLLSPDASALAGKIEVGLRRKSVAADTWEPVSRGKDGASATKAGDIVVLSLRSVTTERLYVTVLWLGMGLGISQLWPPHGSQPLDGGSELAVGGWPMSMPKAPAVPLPAKDPALDLLKIFVTRREVDFSPLLQGSVRNASSLDESGSLSRLLNQALYGKNARALSPASLPEDEDWAAELHQVLVYPANS